MFINAAARRGIHINNPTIEPLLNNEGFIKKVVIRKCNNVGGCNIDYIKVFMNIINFYRAYLLFQKSFEFLNDTPMQEIKLYKGFTIKNKFSQQKLLEHYGWLDANNKIDIRQIQVDNKITIHSFFSSSLFKDIAEQFLDDQTDNTEQIIYVFNIPKAKFADFKHLYYGAKFNYNPRFQRSTQVVDYDYTQDQYFEFEILINIGCIFNIKRVDIRNRLYTEIELDYEGFDDNYMDNFQRNITPAPTRTPTLRTPTRRPMEPLMPAPTRTPTLTRPMEPLTPAPTRTTTPTLTRPIEPPTLAPTRTPVQTEIGDGKKIKVNLNDIDTDKPIYESIMEHLEGTFIFAQQLGEVFAEICCCIHGGTTETSLNKNISSLSKTSENIIKVNIDRDILNYEGDDKFINLLKTKLIIGNNKFIVRNINELNFYLNIYYHYEYLLNKKKEGGKKIKKIFKRRILRKYERH